MQQHTELPAYGQVAQVIQQCHSLVTPAEFHGLVCGLMCLGEHELDHDFWQDNLFHWDQAKSHTPEQQKLLSQLLDYSYDRLTQMEFDFELLLPAEDASLKLRSMELGNWCHGFLTALDSTADPDAFSEQLSIEAYDTLLKLSEVVNLDFEDLDYAEPDEVAYTELTEFVRMAVLMLYSEVQQGVKASHPGNQTIH